MRPVSLADLLAGAGADGRRRLVVALPAADLRMAAVPDLLADAMRHDTRVLAWRAGERDGFVVSDGLRAGRRDVPEAAGIWRAAVVLDGRAGPLAGLAEIDARAAAGEPADGLLARWARAVVDLHARRPRRSRHRDSPWEPVADLLLRRQRSLLPYIERALDAPGPPTTASLASALDMLGWLPSWRTGAPC